VNVHVPRDVGVRLEVEKFLSSIDYEGLTKRDGAYVSDNWDRAQHRLVIRSKTSMGHFELDRTGN